VYKKCIFYKIVLAILYAHTHSRFVCGGGGGGGGGGDDDDDVGGLWLCGKNM
jgi:hypothetical protein